MCVFFFFALNLSFFFIFNRFAEGKSDKEILDHLLKNSRYDKRLLPPVDGESIYLFLLKHIIYNEKTTSIYVYYLLFLPFSMF